MIINQTFSKNTNTKMKKILFTMLLIIGLLTSIQNVQSQTWMSSTSVLCDFNQTKNTIENCKNYINPTSITLYDNTFYLVDLNKSIVYTYNCFPYKDINGFDSYILETTEYVIIFTITDEFILTTINNKQTNTTYLNYYFID